jgi:hypothetical protein
MKRTKDAIKAIFVAGSTKEGSDARKQALEKDK